MGRRFPDMKHKYSGVIRMLPGEQGVKYGSGRTIFIEHMGDLFADGVHPDFIKLILAHCCEWPGNTYVFQTKNPARYASFLSRLPPAVLLGTTIETNRDLPEISKAPSPELRYLAMADSVLCEYPKFVTIEPVLDFDVDILVEWLRQVNPTFVNIGSDSKGHNLPEPTADKVSALITALGEARIEIRQKHNLKRLLLPAPRPLMPPTRFSPVKPPKQAGASSLRRRRSKKRWSGGSGAGCTSRVASARLGKPQRARSRWRW
jgi:hypothetical protein